MKYLKKAIIVLLVLLVIVLICILILNMKTKGNEDVNVELDVSQDYIKSMGLVDDYQTFFSIEKMLNNFIENVASDNKEAAYSLLDNTYIEENNINKDNVLNKISNIAKYNNVRIRKMYRQEDAGNAEYYIDCILEKEHVGEEFYFVLYVDTNNLTYSIECINKENYEQETNNVNRILEEIQIEKNEYNKTEFRIPTEKDRVNKYFKDFIENVLYYPEYTYSILNEEYKDKRFPTLESFQEYITDRKEILLSYNKDNRKKASEFEDINDYYIYLSQEIDALELEGYQIRNEEEYNRYICTDNYGNYYIFYAVSPFNYSIVLDTYTIDLPEFMEKYKIATTEEKVGMNIEKIVEALNGKDYNYIYSKLADEFKANYFKTYEDFEKYAKNTFDIGNEVEFNKYTESENYCTYEITLKGKNKSLTKTIVMKLEEGTDFIMSFNVE